MDSNRFDKLAKEFATKSSRRSIVKGIGATAIGGLLGLAGRSRADAKGEKVGICHVTGSGTQYITVSVNAVPAHLAHGDTVTNLTDVGNCGSCGNSCNDGDACTTDTCESGQCVHTPNPVDCVVSDWSEWSTCSAECGGGTTTRTRSVITEASCGGAACPADLTEEAACNEQDCPGTCGGVTCAPGGACLDGECFTQYPNCPGSYGVAANGGGVNPCICSSGTYEICGTSGDCPDGQVCILIPNGGGGYDGHCFTGCPAY